MKPVGGRFDPKNVPGFFLPFALSAVLHLLFVGVAGWHSSLEPFLESFGELSKLELIGSFKHSFYFPSFSGFCQREFWIVGSQSQSFNWDDFQSSTLIFCKNKPPISLHQTPVGLQNPPPTRIWDTTTWPLPPLRFPFAANRRPSDPAANLWWKARVPASLNMS